MIKQALSIAVTLALIVTAALPTAAIAADTTVITGQIAVAPTITGVTPSNGSPPGSPVSVEINGSDFVQGSVPADLVTVSGTGISVGTLTVTNNKVTTTFIIASDAAPGLRDVSVRVGGATGTRSQVFTVNKYITVSAPSAISLGLMQVGTPATGSSSTPGTVTTNASSWAVTARDQNQSSNSGKMSSGSNYLSGAFQISKTSSGYAFSSDGITYDQSGGNSLPLYAKQSVTSGDTAGTYSITLVFTGSPE